MYKLHTSQISPPIFLDFNWVKPPSRTAGVGFLHVYIYIYLTKQFAPRDARVLCANLTGLASSACHQYVAFNYLYMYSEYTKMSHLPPPPHKILYDTLLGRGGRLTWKSIMLSYSSLHYCNAQNDYFVHVHKCYCLVRVVKMTVRLTLQLPWARLVGKRSEPN